MTEAPDLFSYLDYRQYLKDWCAHRRKSKTGFSQRNFARSAGIPESSSTLLPAIIAGRRNLTENQRTKFTRAMKLKEREERYFNLLVQLDQAKTMENKNHFFAQLSRFHGSRARTLKEGQLKLYSRWWYTVVWNYFGIDQSTRDPARIASKIFPEISPEQAREAVECLLELGLIARTANGYKVEDRHIATEKSVRSLIAKSYVHALTGMALDIFDRVPAKSRQYHALVFSISEKGYRTLRDRIGSFKEELKQIIESDSEEKHVYTLTMQLFPNTRESLDR